MADWLSLVERTGILEIEPDGTRYRWVHDKVEEAAMSLVPKSELPTLKTVIGKILVKELDVNELDSYIFTIVNLLHETGIPRREADRVKLAELCLNASKKASGSSAFDSAGRFATIGIQALPAQAWTNQYDLALELYSSAAEAACFLGQAERLAFCYDAVLYQKDRPLSDKMRVHRAMISYMSNTLGNPTRAVDMLLGILSEFGVKFPKGRLSRLASTITGLFKVKRKVSSLSAEEFLKMPIMDDPIQLEKMRLLDQLFIASYLGNSNLLALSILASTHLTLEHGLCEYSAPTFSALALILGDALGDVELASKTGGFAQMIMSHIDCRNMCARSELWLNGFVFCWTEPIVTMLPKFVKAYETGLSVGDNENAFYVRRSVVLFQNIAQYIVVGFQSGKPLATIHADCKTYVDQMLEFKRETVHADICIYIQMIENLMGTTSSNNSREPTEISDAERFRSHSDHTVLGVFYSCQCILYMYFGEYEKAAKIAIERQDSYAKGIPGHVWIMIETFTRAMVLYAMARRTKTTPMTTRRQRRKQQKQRSYYAKHANKAHKTIKSWIRKGNNQNVKHYDMLLNAEACALKGGQNNDAAEGWFQSAIQAATRRGHIHE
ncbi:MAG: hypothetical protein SGARI_001816, partial [Bacillariaceae sp.]